jgi:hypothetical protein
MGNVGKDGEEKGGFWNFYIIMKLVELLFDDWFWEE